MRLIGVSPNGRSRRAIDVWRKQKPNGKTVVCVWVHSGNKKNGWQVDIEPAELLRAIDRLL